METAGAVLLILASSMSRFSSAFEIVEKSKDVMMMRGRDDAIFCRSDAPYEICKWQHEESGKECRVASDGIDSATSCKDDVHIEWALNETQCGIKITGATRTDAGTYKCTLGVFEDEGIVLNESVKVDVAVPSLVQFQGGFGAEPTVALDAGKEVQIGCQTTGGYPEPDLRAYLSQQSDYNDVGSSDLELDSVHELEERTVQSDGTVTLKKVFIFTPTSDDCGKYVKCLVEQFYREGNLLPSIQDATSRKLFVEFPPEPFEQPPTPFVFFHGDELLRVELTFAANPVPANNQVTWHINPSGRDAEADSLELVADTDFNGKYEALPLNVNGHDVKATLVIGNPTVEEASYGYYLEAHTDKGNQRYDFILLHFVDEDATETISGKRQREEDGQIGGTISSGVIAAIVVVVILCILIIGITIMAKRSNKLCFKYNKVPSKTDAEGQKQHPQSQEPPIIKKGKGGKGENGFKKNMDDENGFKNLPVLKVDY